MRTRASIGNPGPGLAPGPGPVAAALVAAWIFIFLAAPLALAHGVDMTSGTGQAAWVKAAYADGEPMEFAKVRVTAPDGRTFQVGNADAQGRFAWLADLEGEWRATAEDGMGHRGEARLLVGSATPGNPGSAGKEMGGQPPWLGALLGLSLIFWLSGLAFWWKGRAFRKPGA